MIKTMITYLWKYSFDIILNRLQMFITHVNIFMEFPTGC